MIVGHKISESFRIISKLTVNRKNNFINYSGSSPQGFPLKTFSWFELLWTVTFKFINRKKSFSKWATKLTKLSQLM